MATILTIALAAGICYAAYRVIKANRAEKGNGIGGGKPNDIDDTDKA